MTSCGNFSQQAESDLIAVLGECNSRWDTLTAALLICCTLVGIPGNILALGYFWPKRRMSHFFRQLHIFICCIGICICTVNFPVAVSLLNDRYPAMFNLNVLCTTWESVFTFFQKIAMFLVVLLSVSRCFSIAFPDKRLDKKKIILAFPIYSVLLIAHDVLVFYQSGESVDYFTDISHCLSYGPDSEMIWYAIDKIWHGVEVGVPPIVCCVSFVICTVKLRSSSTTKTSRERNARAAVTVTMFTGLFLVCNLPFFIVTVLEYVDMVREKIYPGPLFENNFMFWYSFMLSRVLCTVLNATLNPVLFYYRIPGVKEWIISLFR